MKWCDMLTDAQERNLREEIRNLKDEVALKDEQIIKLKGMLLPKEWYPPRELKLTKYEGTILAFMYKSEDVATFDDLMDLLYYFRSSGEVPDINTLTVLVHRIRRKLQSLGVVIETVRRRGYLLTSESKEILKNWSTPKPDYVD